MQLKISKIHEDEDGLKFKVDIKDRSSKTSHEVTIESSFLAKYGIKNPKKLIKKSFEFLLEREPKEAILSEFNIEEISRYFPEYGEFVKNLN